MGVTERRAREKEELRQSILDAASDLIVTDGAQNLSIRKIAEKIEYAPSTIYLYFPDKFAILAGISIGMFDELSERMKTIEDSPFPDPIEQFRAKGRCYIEFGLANPSHYQVTFQTAPPPELPMDHPICQAINQAGCRTFGMLAHKVSDLMEAGLIEKNDPNKVAQSVWLALHGLTSGLIVMGADPHFPWVEREALIDNHLTMILRGIGAKV